MASPVCSIRHWYVLTLGRLVLPALLHLLLGRGQHFRLGSRATTEEFLLDGLFAVVNLLATKTGVLKERQKALGTQVISKRSKTS